MRTRSAAPVLFGLTIALASCTGETPPTGAASDAYAVARLSAPAPLPLVGRCETRFDPPPFPLPPVHRQVDTGTCQLSHLGRAAVYVAQDINFATGTQVTVEFTLTAANGDVLRATNVGMSQPNGPGVDFSGTMTVIGGTGRFANATGGARLEGTASFLTNTASFTFADGWIAYDASRRRIR
jgi:hypothetical protein